MSSKFETLTLVIPCFNEAANLSELIEICSRMHEEKEISFILVNNGSTDESQQILQKNVHPGISVVDLKINDGYGNGLWQGISSAKTELVGWLHADQANLLNNFDLPEGLLVAPNTFHKGFRVNRSMKEATISRCMGLICSSILKIKLRDINAQPNIYPRSFITKIISPPKDFSFDMYIYANALESGLSENRFEVRMPKRTKGRSSWNTGLFSIVKMSLSTISAAKKFRSRK